MVRVQQLSELEEVCSIIYLFIPFSSEVGLGKQRGFTFITVAIIYLGKHGTVK